MESRIDRPRMINRQIEAAGKMAIAMEGQDIVELKVEIRLKSGEQLQVYSVPGSSFSPTTALQRYLPAALLGYRAGLEKEFSAL